VDLSAIPDLLQAKHSALSGTHLSDTGSLEDGARKEKLMLIYFLGIPNVLFFLVTQMNTVLVGCQKLTVSLHGPAELPGLQLLFIFIQHLLWAQVHI
jgi:hypothetical protein